MLCHKFLTPKDQNLDWTKGILTSWVKEEYRLIINALHRFVTCEGRCVVNFLYHLRLLLHFEGGPEIIFPYFLWMSLNKMARGIKSSSKNVQTSIYHHGLIKLLVVHEINKQGSD